MSAAPAAAGGPDKAPRRRLLFYGFIALMLALTCVFLLLGDWQLRRLAEKETLLANVAARAGEPAAPPPADADWPLLAPGYMDFRPTTLVGRFRYEDTVLVFTSLADAKGRHSGPGFWVMTPFALERGGLVFVNRGFVPQGMQAQFAGGGAGPQGTVSVTGIGRAAERASSFTPGPDRVNRIEWVRDPARLAALIDVGEAPVAPFTLDMPATAPGALPQGGETVMSFPNNHLGYAITWFGFAAITPLLLAYWVWRQRAPPKG